MGKAFIFSADTLLCSVYQQLATVIPHIARIPGGGPIKSQSSTICTWPFWHHYLWYYACRAKGVKIPYF